jgi:hypothetical protein
LLRGDICPTGPLLRRIRTATLDDFFELGGHSLIVVRLFAGIKKTFGVYVGLLTLFERRTVRGLLHLIREASAGAGGGPAPGRSLVALHPNGSRVPLFVISGVGGNVIKIHGLTSSLGGEQTVYGLLPRGLDGDEV